MEIQHKKYNISTFRTVIFGVCLLCIGLFTLWMLIAFEYSKFEISDLFLLPVICCITITTLYFGCKTLFQFNKFIQLELNNKELRYLIVGNGKGAGWNYYIKPSYKTLRYADIKLVKIVTANRFEKHIQITKHQGSMIILPLLYTNEIELQEIFVEIKKRIT